MAQVYTVTASTSVVLINSLPAPNTVVLLSSIRYPGHIVGIRDATGSNSIANNPIIVSTMGGLKFYDGTSSIVLNTPYASLSVSSRDSSTWQQLNTIGFVTTLSNGFLQSLTSKTSYIQVTSTIQESVSSMIAGRITILNSIQIAGQTNIQGDITLGGSLDILSTARFYQNLYLSSGLIVGGNVSFPSSLSLLGDLRVNSNFSTTETLSIAENLTVAGNLYTVGALIPQYVSVQTLQANLLSTGGGVQTAGAISSLSTVVFQNATFLGKGTFQNSTFVSSMTAVAGGLTAKSLSTLFLTVAGNVAVANDIFVQSFTSGSLSTLSSLVSGTQKEDRLILSGETLVEGETKVSESTIVRQLTVEGTAYISSLSVYSILRSMGDSSSYSSTFVTSKELVVCGGLAIGQSLSAPFAYVSLSTGMSTFGELTVGGNLVVSTLASFREDSLIAGSLSSVSTFYISGGLSTNLLDVKGQLFVDGNLNISQIASASTLGAPISLSISTLTLSNTLVIGSFGSIPVLNMNGYPKKINVGNASNVGGYDLYVNGILQNRSTVSQTQSFDYNKLWSGNNLLTSTFGGLPNLSSMLIGSASFDYPVKNFDGILITGFRSDSFTSTNIVSASNQSTLFTSTRGGFGTRGYKIRYNGEGLWVAVGEGTLAGMPPPPPSALLPQSIKASRNGYDWQNAASGGFSVGGRDVAYGNGRWVAVGSNSPMLPGASIQYSSDGVNWQNATGQIFPNIGGFGEAIAFNGSNLWVAAGTDPSAFGLKYSSDGISWQTCTSLFGPLPPTPFYSVGYGGGKWFATNSAGTQVFESANGSNWFNSPSTNIPRRVYKYITLGGNSFWLGGGDTVPSPGGPPMTTIQISPTGGCNWAPIQTGGFTGACYDILFVPELSSILAVGSNLAPTDTIMQYTVNLQNWIPTSVFPGAGYGIAYGPTEGPDTRPYFTGNLTNIFRSTLSSTYIFASTVNASSFTGSYTADGSLLTKVGSYTSSISVSSVTARTIRTYDVSAERFVNNTMQVQDFINVNRKTFLSAGNIFIAAGNDAVAIGNIQTSGTGAAWEKALNSNFEFYGNDVAGTSNPLTPFYVAAGADSQTLNTLQHSINGRVWSPSVSGGFSYATSIGLREAKSVVYNSNLSQWVALGVDIGGTNTIQYSSDGSNWLPATGGFTNYGTKVKTANGRYVAIGAGGPRYSLNGTTWLTSIPTTFTAIGYGQIPVGPAWMGVSETLNTNYYSLDNGVSWFAGTPVGTSQINDLHYANGVWIAVGGNEIRRSVNGFVWTAVTTSFGSDITFKSVVYNTDSQTWLAGAASQTASNTFYRSSDSLVWSAATSGGFSTSVDRYGVGYGITSLGFSTLAVGKSAIDVNLPVNSRILFISTLAGSPSTTVTNFSLTNSNASNVFSSVVRGIAAAPDELYKYVAVGDGVTPQKTIGRSIDGTPGSWIPAVTGGFSPSGYGVMYNQGTWWATGDANATLNTIQYSPDGANWFGTNTAQGIRSGGRAIAVGVSTLASTFVAVGKDTTTSTIITSQDGFNWTNANGGDPMSYFYFNVQGNGVAAGLTTPTLPFGTPPYKPIFIAVGQDTRGRSNTLLSSQDGSNWFCSIGGGGFDVAGYGASYSFDTFTWVIVGEDTNTSNTIQYSLTGGSFWSGVNNGFTKAGYAVGYNSSLSTFFAVGEDINGNSEMTIKTSQNGISWFNISSPSGFLSQKNLGVANGLFTQGIVTQESIPYIDMQNLVVYERATPLLYTRPTIRLQSSLMAFNESLFFNLSSQLIIGSNVPQGSAAVTVYGDVFASSFIHQPVTTLPAVISASITMVSTLSTISTLFTKSFTTPYLTITGANGGPPQPQLQTPNQIDCFTTGGGGGWTGDNGALGFVGNLNINNTLYAYTIPQSIQYPQPIGIGTQNGPGLNVTGSPNLKECDVDGIFGVSSLSTSVVTTSSVFISASQVFFNDRYLSMFASTDNSFVETGNRIQVNASSMTFNSILTLQQSTQRVGLYTRNPQFDLDVQRNAILTNVQASTINSRLLVLTLQSI